jgi:hypothetical protein
MAAIKFVCKTESKAKHDEIKRRLFAARGALIREKVYRETSTEFESEMEMISEGGTLYREVKELGLSTSIYIKEGQLENENT